MRTQFAFYKSFDDVYQDLSDKQKIEFIDVLLDVQFLRLKIEDVAFKDNILKHIWNAQKHSLEKAIKGYLDSQKNEKIKEPYLGIYDPSLTPSEGTCKEVKEQGQGQEQGQKRSSMQKLKDDVILKLEDYPTINKEAFKEWWQYKLYKNIAPITKTLNFLSKYDFDTQQQIVDTSIMNNYKGLFEPKKQKLDRTQQNASVAQEWINEQSVFDGELIEDAR